MHNYPERVIAGIAAVFPRIPDPERTHRVALWAPTSSGVRTPASLSLSKLGMWKVSLALLDDRSNCVPKKALASSETAK